MILIYLQTFDLLVAALGQFRTLNPSEAKKKGFSNAYKHLSAVDQELLLNYLKEIGNLFARGAAKTQIEKEGKEGIFTIYSKIKSIQDTRI